ncbi:uncharacterized protein LOC126672115 isoform X2 [Mercurialis annua]|uniref:uncharacterized protein LOC126672115 isoform X2 n=1 Tax=Mercurialis annua TaxID=3986 RepID=UPI00215F9A8E|nr:uncharacterized protein LOC126672115 isoform X2 [Mercurialis annua]
MNLAAEGSYATFSGRVSSWTRGSKLKQHASTLHMFGRTDGRFQVKRNLRLSVGACFHGPRAKFLRISAFKGSAQNDESRNRANGSNFTKNSVKISYVPKESGETTVESPKVHSVPVSYTSEANEGISGSPAIHKLFKKWLNLLRTQSSNEVADELLDEATPPNEVLHQTQITPNTAEAKESDNILKAIWSNFLGLDATIKTPLLIFIPLYLAVNAKYGAEVSKELTPLWILGPLITAFYVKMLRLLWALYVFTFTQTVKQIKNLPMYFSVTSSYIAQGRLKEDVKARVFQPMIDIKNLDYKELSKKKMKEFEVWFLDKYLDFVESIWPHYCRTIRFLKRANLI